MGHVMKSISSETIIELVKGLKDNDYDVRVKSIESLSSYLDDEMVLGEVSQTRYDPDELVRLAAYELLSDWDDSRAENLLMPGVNDLDWMIRSQSILGLSKFRNGEIDKLVRSRIADSLVDEAEKVRCYLYFSLKGDEEALDGFISLLSSDNYQVRCAIANLIAYYCDCKYINTDKVRVALECAKNKENSRAALYSISEALDAL